MARNVWPWSNVPQSIHGRYIQDVPLDAPKIEMAEKLYFDGFGLSQMTCPKSGQKQSKKNNKNGLGKIWDQKNAKEVVKKGSKNVIKKMFLDN